VAALAIARGRRPLELRRALAVAALAAAAGAGVLLMRGGDVEHFARFLGIGHKPHDERNVESYVHRSLLAYIGVRIFADHPFVGVGCQGSEEYDHYAPYLADAAPRFPRVPPLAFSSLQHPWG